MTDDARIADLVARFTPEGAAGETITGYGDHFLFSVGRDDAHGILHDLIPRERLGFKLGIFGFDDDQLNEDILGLMANPTVHVQGTEDRSQAGGVHARKILEHDLAVRKDFLNFWAIGQSATHQINHTKAALFVGLGIGIEGSTNWSDSGEGTGINLAGPQRPGWKAQNNTLLVSTNPVFLSRLGARLDVEHHIAAAQQAVRIAAGKPW